MPELLAKQAIPILYDITEESLALKLAEQLALTREELNYYRDRALAAGVAQFHREKNTQITRGRTA